MHRPHAKLLFKLISRSPTVDSAHQIVYITTFEHIVYILGHVITIRGSVGLDT